MKRALFFVFLFIFAATATMTLLGVANLVPIRDEYLQPLLGAVLLEGAGVCIALFRKTDFFATGDAAATSVHRTNGGWWQLAFNHDAIALTFVDIRAKGGRMPTIEGASYATGGKSFARWTSEVTLFRDATHELFYLWQGEEYRKLDDTLIGVGSFRFADTFDRGTGWFTESALGEGAPTRRIKVDIRRASASEVDVMRGKDQLAKRSLLADLEQQWRAGIPQVEPRPERRQVDGGSSLRNPWLELLGVAEVYPSERDAEQAILAAVEATAHSVDVIGVNHRSYFQNDALLDYWRRFAAKRGRKLRLFLLDPEGPGVDVIASREHSDPGDVRAKIQLTLNELRRTFAVDGAMPDFLEVRKLADLPKWRVWALDLDSQGTGGTIFAKGYVPHMTGAELPMLRLIHAGFPSALFRLLQSEVETLRGRSTPS